MNTSSVCDKTFATPLEICFIYSPINILIRSTSVMMDGDNDIFILKRKQKKQNMLNIFFCLFNFVYLILLQESLKIKNRK